MSDKKTNKDSHEKGDNKIDNKKEQKVDPMNIDPKNEVKSEDQKKSASPEKKPALKEVKSAKVSIIKNKETEKQDINKQDTEKPEVVKELKSEEKVPENKDKTPKDQGTDSNYQVSLVDENTLKIKIKTDKGVSLNSTVGGKNVLPQGVDDLLNKLGSGKDGEIEIEISINPEKKSTEVASKEDSTEVSKDDKSSLNEDSITPVTPGALIPNPEVEDIVNKTVPLVEEVELTDEEKLREKIGRKSPWNVSKRVYAQNFQIGVIGGVIIYLVAVFSFYAYGSKQKIVEPEQQQRLIVLQDLPDPKINLQNIEDPNAPPEEETDESETTVPKRIPTVRRNFNSPVIKRPQSENSGFDNDTTSDSTSNLADTNTVGDTSTASGNNLIDSTMNEYTGDAIGIKMRYPSEWVVRDPSSINTNLPENSGLVLADTTIAQGDMNLFLHIDNTGEDAKKDKFSTPFEMADSTLTAFTADIRNEGGRNIYRFYIYGLDKKLFVEASIREKIFDKYKPIVESIVRSISFPPKPS